MSGDGGPAFPGSSRLIEASADQVITQKLTDGGMTLRDYFAGQALANLNLQAHMDKYTSDVQKRAAESMAGAAYEIADAMLAERDK